MVSYANAKKRNNNPGYILAGAGANPGPKVAPGYPGVTAANNLGSWSYQQAWRLVVVAIFCVWLCGGGLIQTASAGYVNMMGEVSALKQAYTQAHPAPQAPSLVGQLYQAAATELFKYNTRFAKLPTSSITDSPIYSEATKAAQDKDKQQAEERAYQAYGQLPLSFELNQGQADSQVKFLARGSSYNLYLTDNALFVNMTNLSPAGQQQLKAKIQAGELKPDTDRTTLIKALEGFSPNPNPGTGSGGGAGAGNQPAFTQAILKLSLANANPQPHLVGLDPLPGRTNYLLGNDRSQWRTEVPSYRRVKYQDVYPGIDQIFYGQEGQLEYDLVVQPGANPDQITLNFEGADRIELVDVPGSNQTQSHNQSQSQAGKVALIHLGSEVITQALPQVYQENNGQRQAVSNQYVLRGGGNQGRQLGFKLGSYDHNLPLVIDPSIVYATLLGTGAAGYNIKVDGSGNAYIVGWTNSSAFSTTTGAYSTTLVAVPDAFVIKLNITGTTTIYSAIIGGGTNTYSYGYGIAIDNAGNAYIYGQTNSAQFPTTANAFRSTCAGTQALPNGFVAELNNTGSQLLYSSYLGNQEPYNGSSRDTLTNNIAVGANGNIYVGDSTLSLITFTNSPAITGVATANSPSNDNPDSFVEVISPTATSANQSLRYFSYLGGTGFDELNSLAVDRYGLVYVTGETKSADFPTTPNALLTRVPTSTNNIADVNYAFVAKLDPTISGTATIRYATYLGASPTAFSSNPYTEGLGIAVITDTIAYVTGATNLSTFPTTPSAAQKVLNRGILIAHTDSGDAFVSKIDTSAPVSGSVGLLYSTFLGGGNPEKGLGITGDLDGNVYVVGHMDTDYPLNGSFYHIPGSWGFPLTRGALQYESTTENGDSFLAKIDTSKDCDTLIFSTFFGNGASFARGIALDTAGNAYVTGGTAAPFSTTVGAYDNQSGDSGFALKLKLNDIYEHVLGLCPPGADPCASGNGNYVDTFADLSTATPNGTQMVLEAVRTYNSLDKNVGLLGQGWRFNYEMQLVTATDQSVLVINPDGRRDRYGFVPGSTTYSAPSRANATLTRFTSSFVLTTANQLAYTFDLTGKLQTIKDRNSNTITLTYDAISGLLSQVQDGYGRSFKYFYGTGNQAQRVVRIEEHFTGGALLRTVYYTYDTSTGKHLIAVQDVRSQSSQTTRYHYTPDLGLLDQQFDQNNHQTLQNQYDCQGFLLNHTLKPDANTNYNSALNYNKPNPNDNFGQLPSSPPVKVDQTYLTDSRSFTTTYKMGGLSLLPEVFTSPVGSGQSSILNPNDNRQVFTDTNGTVAYFTYNPFGKMTGFAKTVSVLGQTQVISSSTHYTPFNDPDVVTDTRGNVTHYNYNPSGTLKEMIDPLNHKTSYSYDAQGHLQEVDSPGGLHTYYYYPNGLYGQPDYMVQTYSTLLTTTGQLGQVSYRTDFQYNNEGWLSYRSDPYPDGGPNPNIGMHYQYDPQGHVLTVTNQLGQNASNQYDPTGNLVAATNFLGQQTTYSYDWLHRLTQQVQVITAGNALTTTYYYDAASNVITLTDPRGVNTYYGYDPLNRLVTTTLQRADGTTIGSIRTYNSGGDLQEIRQLSGTSGLPTSGDELTDFSYDEYHRLIKTTYDPNGLNYQEVNVYDAGNNLVQLRRSKGSVTAGNAIDGASVNYQDAIVVDTSYDELARPKSSSLVPWSSAGTPAPLVTSYSYDDVANRHITTDSYGVATTVQNDAAGRVLSTTVAPKAGSSEAAQTTSHYYDSRGLQVRVVDPAGNVSEADYDLVGRPLHSTLYAGPGRTNPVVTSLSYNDTNLPVVTSVGSNGDQTQLQYDAAGRLLSQSLYPAGSGGSPLVTSFGYDGQSNLTSISAPGGAYTAYNYDTPGWLLSVNQKVDTSGTVYTSSYQYDGFGNLTRYTDANSHYRTYGYDQLNRLSSQQDQLDPAWTYSYDGADRLVLATDALGQSSRYEYDNASRPLTYTTQPGSGGSQPAITTTFAYNTGSRPLTMTDQVGGGSPFATAWAYDGFNRPLTVTNGPGVVGYRYDTLGRRSDLSFGLDSQPANQKGVHYAYDGLSRPVTVTNWQSGAVSYHYTGALLDQMQYPNGVTARFGYDGADRLVGITQTNTGGTTLYGAIYNLDERGNRLTANETVSNTARQLSYGYDLLDRLITDTTVEASPYITTNLYSYDGVGNRLSQQVAVGSNPSDPLSPPQTTQQYGFSYNELDQVITATNTNYHPVRPVISTYYQYDADGNRTGQSRSFGLHTPSPVATYTFDVRNRLIATGSTNQINYDGNNQRLSQTNSGATTNYLVDGLSELPVVLEERGATATSDYLYGAGGSTTPLFQSDSSGTSRYYHADGLGSVRVLSDGASGAPLSAYNYTSYGQDYSQLGNSAITNTHKFAGEQLDPSGLYYNRARYYDPSTASFISSDANPGSPMQPLTENRYLYTGGNPVNRIDPSGYGFVEDTFNALVEEGKKYALVTATGFSLIAHGGDTEAVVKEVQAAVDKNPEIRRVVGEIKEEGSDKVIKDMVGTVARSTPGVGEVIGLTEAATGQDLFTGRTLSKGERLLALGVSGLGIYGGFLRGVSAEARAAGAAAREGVEVGAGEVRSAVGEARAAAGGAGEEAGSVGRAASSEKQAAEGEVANAGTVCSFSSDTPVATDQGAKPIGDLHTGDHVLAYNQALGSTGSYTVTAILVNHDPAIEYLTLDGETLTTTPEHPFFTQERGWTPAGALVQGDHVRKADGSYGLVQRVKVVAQPSTMYNLTVAVAHTFFVGQHRWLVHNTCAPGDGSTNQLPTSGSQQINNSSSYGHRVLFGQRRIDPYFSMKSEVPHYLSGRSIYDVAEDLRQGILTADQIHLEVFEFKGQLVSVNNRGLAALSLAGLRPTNITRIQNPATQYLARLNQRSLLGGYKLPSTFTVVTPRDDITTILDIIRIPS